MSIPKAKPLQTSTGEGGYREIQKKLEVSKWKVVALGAGQSYCDCSAKESTHEVRIHP